MAGTIHYELSHNIQWVYVQSLPQYGCPVYHNTTDHILFKHHILYRIAVEDSSTSMVTNTVEMMTTFGPSLTM